MSSSDQRAGGPGRFLVLAGRHLTAAIYNMKLMRFYSVLRALFTVGRWGLSLGGAEYEKTHRIFSIVILTNISSAYYVLLTRNFVGGGIKRAIVLGASLAIASPLVIFLSTALLYATGMQTFLNHPRALNVDHAIPLEAGVGA